MQSMFKCASASKFIHWKVTFPKRTFAIKTAISQKGLTPRQTLLIGAFENFKLVHEHCDVPHHFQVPVGNIEWPECFSKIKLGHALTNIRRKNSNEVLKPSLVQLGFNVEPLVDYEDMKLALLTFKELEGHAQVPCDFRIPREDNRYPEPVRGMHLGSAVHGTQVYGLYKQHHNELKEMGVNFEIIGAYRASFDVIYDASTAFEKVYHNLNVPYCFIVPSLPAYPKNTWGLELGLALALIRADTIHNVHKDKLLLLGLNASVNTPSSFPTVFKALKAYKSNHGNLNISLHFIVPQGDDRYPADTWGMKLGLVLQNIRVRGTFAEHHVAFDELGVDFEFERKDRRDFLAQICPALEAYKAIHDDLNVPGSFVVPQGDDRYPVDTWGMKLGGILSQIRNGGQYVQFKERLIALGFVYEPVIDVQFIKVYSALEVYKIIHGDLKVLNSFVVPQDDGRYPIDTWGLKLGNNVKNIRNHSTFSEHRSKLEELGFIYEPVSNVRFAKIYSALETYKAIHGNLKVPVKFVVPQGDDRYPVVTWGVKLGSKVSDIRYNGAYAKHRVKLEELGIVYKDSKPIVEIV